MDINIFSIIFIILLVLKLTGLAQIGWIWVFSPVIVNLAIVLIGLFIAWKIEKG